MMSLSRQNDSILTFVQANIGAADDSLAIIWNEFNQTIVELDNLRRAYFTFGALKIDTIEKHIQASNDEFGAASHSVYNWTAMILKLLPIHRTAIKESAHRCSSNLNI